MIDVGGALYGTTPAGGVDNRGIVYRLSSTGVERVIHRFAGAAGGEDPLSGLVDVSGTLYGTTEFGGGTGCESGAGCGIVYRISPSGKESVVYAFAGGSDGADPQAALIDLNGTLYGTTNLGGQSCPTQGSEGRLYGCGTVYGIAASGKETVLHAFSGENGDGAFPEASLTVVNGSLYGTTTLGGSHGVGTVFRVTTAGAEKVLYSFGAPGTNGALPESPLLNVNGKLYGTTSESNSRPRGGTVFRIQTDGSETLLHVFSGRTDGRLPLAGLIDADGTLYGTTEYGGKRSSGGACKFGCGTIYALSSTGAERVVYDFTGGTDGAEPEATLVDAGGTLYGTTRSGGDGLGTVFALKP
ncbi:MAG TPA: choice-of-anchor tandem repeat GloVer-containing protein [Candidatus Cybelea sp.]|nr:choice-of-anchor tandem repeat GloVer-containing protein [Candidatus Cybelea sp.]